MKKIIVLIVLFNLIVQPNIAQSEFGKRLADSAFTLTKQKIKYVPTYFQIKYPNGDVPSDKGVCTDVIIRTYRMHLNKINLYI